MILSIIIFISLNMIVEAQTAPTSANITCLIKPRSKCFAGKCPSGFTCVSDLCCRDSDIIKRTPDCKDFLDGCESVNCHNPNGYEFARANCAYTCGFCFEKPLAPEYNCDDILDDCKSRVQLCSDREYITIMNLYCPRTCARCNFLDFDQEHCVNTFDDCESRGKAFCNSEKTTVLQKKVGCGIYCNAC